MGGNVQSPSQSTEKQALDVTSLGNVAVRVKDDGRQKARRSAKSKWAGGNTLSSQKVIPQLSLHTQGQDDSPQGQDNSSHKSK